MFETYLKAIISAPDSAKQGILVSASKRVSLQELELLSSAAKLSAVPVRNAMFNKLWNDKIGLAKS